VVTYPRSIAGVKVAVVLREEAAGKVKVSLRGKGEIPVNRIAGRFGGGGHENAAGCTLPGPLASARATVLAAVRQALGGAAS
jgi:phosphoesterase RecJ-like protein